MFIPESAISVALKAAYVPRRVHLILGWGQSNMSGRGTAYTPYRVAHTGVVPSLPDLSNGDALHADAEQHRLNAPVAVGELLRVKSGRAPLFADYVPPPEPTIGASRWLDAATAADAATIHGRSTETGGKTWTRAGGGANNYTVGITGNEFAPKGPTTGGTATVTVTDGVLSWWVRYVVTVFNQYMRMAVKVIDDTTYIVAYMTSDTAVVVRKYVSGVSTEFGSFAVPGGAHEILMGWVEAEQRLIVKHNGATMMDTTVLDAVFQNCHKAGFVIPAVAPSLTGRMSEFESLDMAFA